MSGKAIDLVLLHGFCENSSLWQDIVPKLNFKGKIYTPNLPGFGSSPLPEPSFTIADVAKHIYNELTLAGVQKIICIGHSLGGYVALALKEKYPKFVYSLGLLHSTAKADSLEKKETRTKLIQFLENHEALQFLSGFAATLFCNPNSEQIKKSVARVAGMSEGVTGATLVAYTQAMKNRPDLTHILYNEDTPLFFAGKCDGAVAPADSQEQINAIKNNKNCYFEDQVAHMGMYECPKMVVRAINSFIEVD